MANSNYVFGDGSEEPLYLTSGCCEVTHAYLEDLFVERGLSFGEFDGEFYPLTKAEETYIGEHFLNVADGFGALLGYSALYQGKKYLMPSVETYFGNGSDVSREEALDYAKALSTELRGRVEAIGGHVFLQEDHVDRHLIQVLVPFDYAMSKANTFEEWSAHLEDCLLASDLTVTQSLGVPSAR